MRFLKASLTIISISIRKPATWVSFFLFVVIFFTVFTAKAIPPFQEFKNDLGSSGYLKLRAIADPENINSGGRFVLHVKIEMSEGWHIYSLDAKGDEEESLATEITLNSDSFVPQDSWEEPAPTIGWDGALERVVKTHERIVEFRRRYRVVESLAPGFHRIKGAIVFRACNNKTCNLPRKISFMTEIKVLEGSS